MKNRYKISEAIETVAEGLQGGGDYSPTTIRCAINDTLDAMSKDGYAVHFGYDQNRAVASVRRLLGVTVTK